MLPKRNLLMTPGPTPIPPQVLAVSCQPIIHHRTAEFGKILGEVTEGLKYVFQTKNDILIFPGAGTGGMEASVVNLFSPEEKVIVMSTGVFGDRWASIGESFGLKVEKINAEWGEAVDPHLLQERLERDTDKEVKAVFATLSETSTGVENDIEALGKVVYEHGAIFIVDAISGLGATWCRTDDWHIDLLVVGSQKGLMIPPGLAIVSISSKAWERVKRSTLPKYYWNFEKARKSLVEGPYPSNPYTPSISLIIALKESLALIREEGLENVIARHQRLARATREGVKALGLELFAPSAPSNSVTSIKIPEGIDGGVLVKRLRERYGITISGGQSKLKGKIFRVGHVGYVDELDIIITLAALELTLQELGYKVELGASVRAAEEVFLEMTKPQLVIQGQIND